MGNEGFGRYMLFVWEEYDNPSPFECLNLHSDNYQEVKDEFDKIAREIYYQCIIFDRVKGVIIDSKEGH